MAAAGDYYRVNTSIFPSIFVPSLTAPDFTVITGGIVGLFMDATSRAQLSDPLRDRICSWVEEHGDYLFSYALRHFNSRSEAEDLVQETFLGALQSASSFKNESAVRTWLTGILRHKIFDRIRKKQTESKAAQEIQNEDFTLDQFDNKGHWSIESSPNEWKLTPEEAYQRNDFYSKVQECLAKLPEKFRSVFLMRELDGLSREEVGKVNGLSGNNIGVILHRVRCSLRECLEKNWLK